MKRSFQFIVLRRLLGSIITLGYVYSKNQNKSIVYPLKRVLDHIADVNNMVFASKNTLDQITGAGKMVWYTGSNKPIDHIAGGDKVINFF